KGAQLFERGFGGSPLAWLQPSLGTVDAMVPVNATPPNLREDMCGKHRKRPAAEDADEDIANTDANSPLGVLLSSLRPHAKGSELVTPGLASAPPVVVYTGATRTPGAIELAGDSDPLAKRGKRGRKAAPEQAAAAGTIPPPSRAGRGRTPRQKSRRPHRRGGPPHPQKRPRPSVARPPQRPNPRGRKPPSRPSPRPARPLPRRRRTPTRRPP